MKEDPNLSSWVYQGLAYHKSRKTENCLFCEQPLPKDRIPLLEAHFNAEYDKLLKRIDAKVLRLNEASREITKLTLPNPAQLYDDFASEYEKVQNVLRESLETIKRALTP